MPGWWGVALRLETIAIIRVALKPTVRVFLLDRREPPLRHQSHLAGAPVECEMIYNLV